MQTQLLLNRLEEMNVSPYIINLSQDLLTGRQQRVKVNSHMSPYIPVQVGVPQGTISGPLYLLLMTICHLTALPSNMRMISPFSSHYQKLIITWHQN